MPVSIDDPQVRRLLRYIKERGTDGLSKEEVIQASQILEEAYRTSEERMFEEYYPAAGTYSRDRYPKHLELFRAGGTHRERCMMGGNRTGKSVCGAYETTCHLTGNYPDWWDGRRFNEPTFCLSAGKFNETVKLINQTHLLGEIRKDAKGRNYPTCRGFVPGDLVVPNSLTSRGSVQGLAESIRVRYRDSEHEESTLSLKAYEQGRGSFEGVSRHFIWLDEEPPWDVYEECLLRTATVNGLIMLTFTPLDGITKVVEQFLPKAWASRPARDVFI